MKCPREEIKSSSDRMRDTVIVTAPIGKKKSLSICKLYVVKNMQKNATMIR